MRGFIPFTLNKFAFALLRAGFAQLIDIALRKSTLVLLWQHLFEANGITTSAIIIFVTGSHILNSFSVEYEK
jgi:hypothetical protein